MWQIRENMLLKRRRIAGERLATGVRKIGPVAYAISNLKQSSISLIPRFTIGKNWVSLHPSVSETPTKLNSIHIDPLYRSAVKENFILQNNRRIGVDPLRFLSMSVKSPLKLTNLILHCPQQI
jgi:hypothetical protein